MRTLNSVFSVEWALKSFLSNWLKLLIFFNKPLILSSIRFHCIFLFFPYLFTILVLVIFSLVHYNVRVSSSDLIYFWILYYCTHPSFTNGAEQMCFVLIYLTFLRWSKWCTGATPAPRGPPASHGTHTAGQTGTIAVVIAALPLSNNQSLACQWTLFYRLYYCLVLDHGYHYCKYLRNFA